MEDRQTAGLYLEMTDQPVDEYVAARLPEVLGRPGVTSSLVGARSTDQMSGNLAAARVTPDPSAQAALTALSDTVMKKIPDVGNIFNFYP